MKRIRAQTVAKKRLKTEEKRSPGVQEILGPNEKEVPKENRSRGLPTQTKESRHQ